MINMNFDLNALKIFIAVYENNGIENASKKLYLTQPAVSIAIKKLEEKLNGKLFTRLPRGIKPTPEGEKFYNDCKEAFLTIQNGIENFSLDTALQFGTLNIGASTSMIKYILMPILKDFCKLYPNVKISFTEVIASRLQKYLVNGEIDIAFMEEPIKNLQIYDSKKICTLSNCFVAGTQFGKNSLTKNELKACQFAVLKKNTNHRDLFEKICLQEKMNLNITYQMASFETLAEICENNLAIGFVVKEFIEDKIKNKKLKCVQTDLILPESPVYALLPKSDSSGYVCQKFLELVLARYEQKP